MSPAVPAPEKEEDFVKRLSLSRTDKKRAGVCGGMAECVGIDATVVRLVTALLAIVTGIVPLVIAYGVAWILVPVGPRA
jgi:phage shock protein PspC (stress-responsive transcriptional regulator)